MWTEVASDPRSREARTPVADRTRLIPAIAVPLVVASPTSAPASRSRIVHSILALPLLSGGNRSARASRSPVRAAPSRTPCASNTRSALPLRPSMAAMPAPSTSNGGVPARIAPGSGGCDPLAGCGGSDAWPIRLPLVTVRTSTEWRSMGLPASSRRQLLGISTRPS